MGDQGETRGIFLGASGALAGRFVGVCREFKGRSEGAFGALCEEAGNVEMTSSH